MKKKVKIIIVLILVIGTASAIYAYKEYNRGQKDLSKEKADLVVNATDLYKAFSDDETNANTIYLDKVVAVKGKVISGDKDAEGNYTVQLDAGSDMGVISCQMDPKYNADAAKLQAGNMVTLKGTCTGILMDVVLIRCVLEKNK